MSVCILAVGQSPLAHRCKLTWSAQVPGHVFIVRNKYCQQELTTWVCYEYVVRTF